MKHTFETVYNSLKNPLFENGDFSNKSLRGYWNEEFTKASNIKNHNELREWAKLMLEYIDDITLYYVKEETEQLLKDIINLVSKEEKRYNKLDSEITKLGNQREALRHSLYLLDEKIKNAHAMTLIENQKFHDEWVAEESHLTNDYNVINDMVGDINDKIDSMCHEWEQLNGRLY